MKGCFGLRILVALLALCCGVGTVSAKEPLRIGTEGAYPPFNEVGPEGELRGFDIDIANALCRRLGRECVFVTREWDRIIPGLLEGDYDAIVASMSITGKRDQVVDFTRRYYSNKLRLVAAESSEIMPRRERISGRRIGVQRATIADQWLERNMGDFVEIARYELQNSAFEALRAGHVDAVLADLLVAYQWLNSDAGRPFAFKGESVYIGDRIGIAVREGDDDLRQALNEAIGKIREDGTYMRINLEYFPFDIY